MYLLDQDRDSPNKYLILYRPLSLSEEQSLKRLASSAVYDVNNACVTCSNADADRVIKFLAAL